MKEVDSAPPKPSFALFRHAKVRSRSSDAPSPNRCGAHNRPIQPVTDPITVRTVVDPVTDRRNAYRPCRFRCCGASTWPMVSFVRLGRFHVCLWLCHPFAIRCTVVVVERTRRGCYIDPVWIFRLFHTRTLVDDAWTQPELCKCEWIDFECKGATLFTKAVQWMLPMDVLNMANERSNERSHGCRNEGGQWMF